LASLLCTLACKRSNYAGNPRFSLVTTASSTALLLRLSAPTEALRPALNVAVFLAADGTRAALPQRARPTPDKADATSNEGVYTDGACGCVARASALPPGAWVIVVSTFAPQEARFELSVHARPAPAEFGPA
jgi:hypothetical protein